MGGVSGLLMVAALWSLEGPTVLVVRAAEDPWRAAEGRTRDELRMMGLRVEEVQARGEEVARVLVESGAAAAVVVRRTGGAEVWIAGQDVVRRVSAGGADEAGVVALRAAEVVHAGVMSAVLEDRSAGRAEAVPGDRFLVEHVAVPEDRSGESVLEDRRSAGAVPEDRRAEVVTVVPRVAVRPAETRPFAPQERAVRSALPGEEELPEGIAGPSRPRARRGLELGVHAGVAGGPGGARPLLDVTAGLRIGLTRTLALEPGVMAGVTPARANFAEGAVRLGLAGVQTSLVLVLAPGRAGARVAPWLMVGGGLAIAWARGQAVAPLDARTDVAAVGAVSAGVGVAIRARERVRVHVGAGTVVLLPPVAVRVAGDEVARLGSPLIRGSIGVAWGWPR